MTPLDQKRIVACNDALTASPTVEFLSGPDGRSGPFAAFCEDLERLAPRIRVVRQGQGKNGPLLRIRERIDYRAIPLGAELEPFLEALDLSVKGTIALEASLKGALERVSHPLSLSIYVTPQCPFCPATVRQWLRLALAGPHIRLTVIDGLLFPESAQAEGIVSVPTLLIDGGFRWTGAPEPSEVLRVGACLDPEHLSASSLEALLRQGQASQVARMMLTRKRVFPAFMELVTDEKWPVRLGAMVAMEEVLEADPALAASAVEPLWERLDDVNDQVKGDLLYLMGKVGTPDLLPALEDLLARNLDDAVREAAREAVEDLREKALSSRAEGERED